MSIIYDALKKTQKEFSLNQKKQISLNTQKNKKTLFPITIGIVAMICLLGATIFVFLPLWPENINKKFMSTISLMSNQERNTNISSRSLYKKSSESIYSNGSKSYMKLTGIIKLGAIRSAVINDKIFYEGDTINGGKILEILPNQVSILKNDTMLTLILER